MPYPSARYFMLFVAAVIVGGFWPSYFSVWSSAPWQFHAHGIAASIWVTMVTVQCWTAHDKNQLALHRAIGRTSLFLFPFLIGGLAAIIGRTGQGFVAADDPVRVMFGPTFLIGLSVAVAAYVTVYYRALKYRRKVWVHSGYMLSTPLILFESPFSRLLNMFVPGFTVRGPADFGRIMTAIDWSIGLELLFIAVLWLRFRDKARPFLVTGAFITAELLVLALVKDPPVLKSLLTFVGHTPGGLVWLAGFSLGALTSWAGWQAGKQPQIPATPALQPA